MRQGQFSLPHQLVAARSMAISHQSLSPLLFHFISLYFLSYLTTQSCPDIFYYFISSSIFSVFLFLLNMLNFLFFLVFYFLILKSLILTCVPKYPLHQIVLIPMKLYLTILCFIQQFCALFLLLIDPHTECVGMYTR